MDEMESPGETAPIVFAHRGADLVSEIDKRKTDLSEINKFYLKKDRKLLVGFFQLSGSSLRFDLKHLAEPVRINSADAEELTEKLDLVCEPCALIKPMEYDYEFYRIEYAVNTKWFKWLPGKQEIVAKIGREKINLDLNYKNASELADRVFGLYLRCFKGLKKPEEKVNLVLYV